MESENRGFFFHSPAAENEYDISSRNGAILEKILSLKFKPAVFVLMCTFSHKTNANACTFSQNKALI